MIEAAVRMCAVEGCDRSGKLTRGMCHRHYVRWWKYGDPLVTRRPDLEMSLLERIVSRLATQDPDLCWLMQGGICKDGYARLTDQGRKVAAHRAMYEHFIGPVPEGLELDHVCHSRDLSCSGGDQCVHRACVNPSHLEPVTKQVNAQRSVRGRRTHCVAGHEFTPENTRIGADGRRVCRACVRRNQRNYKARKKVAR